MEQGTTAWHEFRAKGIGSSDAPTIMGVSPWSTPYQLWEEKCGFVKRDVSNYATKRGHDLEPVARANYELETGLMMPPTLAVHQHYDWLRASLDGFNKDENIVLEIKCPGKDDHELAINGKVPEKYYPQLQHQLLVTGAKVAHYYSFDGNKAVLIEVMPNLEYIDELFLSEREFWNKVTSQTPPKLTDKDVKVSRIPELISKADDLSMIMEKIKELETAAEDIKEQLKAACDHPIVQFGKIKAQRVFRAGNIDYKSIKELENVDLEQYRKKGSEYFTFKIEKK